MNRKERREQQKKQRQMTRQKRRETPKELQLTRQQMVAGLIRNGITTEDLQKEFVRGFDEGYRQASAVTLRTVYAALCLALNDVYGFGAKRCGDVLRAVDQHVVNTLASTEAIDEVYRRMKLSINFSEPFDRIIQEG